MYSVARRSTAHSFPYYKDSGSNSLCKNRQICDLEKTRKRGAGSGKDIVGLAVVVKKREEVEVCAKVVLLRYGSYLPHLGWSCNAADKIQQLSLRRASAGELGRNGFS